MNIEHPSPNSKLIEYKDAYIIEFPNGAGVDTVDPKTGRTRTSKTVRAAKWNLSVWRRLSQEFLPKPHPAVV